MSIIPKIAKRANGRNIERKIEIYIYQCARDDFIYFIYCGRRVIEFFVFREIGRSILTGTRGERTLSYDGINYIRYKRTFRDLRHTGINDYLHEALIEKLRVASLYKILRDDHTEREIVYSCVHICICICTHKQGVPKLVRKEKCWAIYTVQASPLEKFCRVLSFFDGTNG